MTARIASTVATAPGNEAAGESGRARDGAGHAPIPAGMPGWPATASSLTAANLPGPRAPALFPFAERAALRPAQPSGNPEPIPEQE